MHILHILPHLSSGGAERQMLYLSQELLRNAHVVDIAYLYEGEKGLQPTFIADANYFKIKCRNNYDPAILLQLILLINKRKPDIIHTWIRQMDILGGLAAVCLQKPWLLREPNSKKAYPANWKHRLRIKIAHFAKAIVANSEDGLMYWQSFYPQKKLSIIPNGIPIQVIENHSANVHEWDSLLSSNYIMYAGRIEKQKNIDTLIRAIYRLNQTRNLKLIVCGHGKQKPFLAQLVRELNLDNKVFLIGAVSPENVWSFMKQAKAFVLLSEYEGLPNVVLEAMVCQCPLIVSDIPAHRAFLDEQQALWVNKIAPENAADQILEIINKPEDAKNRAKKAREAIEKWSVQNMAREYEKVYQWII